MAFVRKFKYEIILGILIAVFIAVFSWLSIQRYLTLNSYYYDLGIMNQVVDNTSRGRFLEMTNQQLETNANRIAIHFDPILAAFAPLYWIYRSPAMLVVAQAVIVGLGALAVYLLGLKILKNKPTSLLFAAAYLLYFQVQRAVLFDFHAVTLAMTFLLFAFYFQETKKPLPYFIFIILSLLTKEHVGMVVVMYGIYIMIFKKDIKIGLGTVALGTAFFVSTVFFAIPYFRQQNHFALKYFSDFGDSPSAILVNVFVHPWVTLRKIISPDSTTYIIRLFTPMLYSLFSPFTVLIAIPEFAINILSINTNMRSYFFHYSSLIIPVIFYATILGYKSFNSIFKDRKLQRIALIIFMVANAVSFYLYNPVPQKLVKDPVSYGKIDSIKQKTISFLMNRLKDDQIKISTTPKLAPFFTNRQYYHNFLYDTAYSEMGQTEEQVLDSKLGSYEGYDYVIIDLDEIGALDSGQLPVKFYQNLRQSKSYEMILSNDKTIEVYKRKDGKKPLFTDGEM